MPSIGYTAYLNCPNDWDDWNQQFMSKAVAKRIWKKIDPDTADQHSFLEEPQRPKLHDYPVGGAFLQTLSRKRRNEAPVRDGRAPEGVEITVAHLSAEGKSDFQLDWDIYKDARKMYENEQNSIDLLKDIIGQTVTSHIFSACCPATESLRDWYSNLKQHSSLGQDQLDAWARERYLTAIQSLTEIPQDPEAWLQAWEKAIINGQTRQLPETLSPIILARDFFNVVRGVFPDWARFAEREYRTQIFDRTLTY